MTEREKTQEYYEDSELFKKLKLYSITLNFIKLFIIIITISAIIYVGCIVCSTFFTINQKIPIIFGTIMVIGMFCVTISLIYIEQSRNIILEYDFKMFLQLFSQKLPFVYNYFYYNNFIDVLVHKVRITYFDITIPQNINDANACLNNILLDNTHGKVPNKFVYDNRSAFIDICNKILNKCDNWDSNLDLIEILNFYNKNKDQKDPNVNKKIWHIISNKINVGLFVYYAKIIILLFNLVAFIIQIFFTKSDGISIIFNFSAIVLVFFDLLERKLNEKND